MSVLPRSATWISPEEYCQGERWSVLRHEYLAGEVYAMGGASITHTRLAVEIASRLNGELQAGPCEVFSHDVKVNISEGGQEWYYYPDIIVSCDPAGVTEYACTTPAVIFEILSPETEGIDRREKLMAYRTIGTLHTYVLVAQRQREITVYRKDDAGLWTTELLPRDGETLRLPQLGCALTLDAIYRRAGV